MNKLELEARFEGATKLENKLYTGGAGRILFMEGESIIKLTDISYIEQGVDTVQFETSYYHPELTELLGDDKTFEVCLPIYSVDEENKNTGNLAGYIVSEYKVRYCAETLNGEAPKSTNSVFYLVKVELVRRYLTDGIR